MDLLADRFKESKLKVKKAQGAWLYSEDGNKYVDYLLGNCCQILGHSHPRVIEAIKRQSEICTNVGDNNYYMAYDLAKEIVKLSDKDAVRFVNSGSEAVHLAIRLARAYTQRKYILKFVGHYHGWYTEEISKFVKEIPYKGGILEEYTSGIICVDWNEISGVQEAFEKYKGEIAAVICEPVLCHAGPIPPVEGFLEKLRSLTKENDSLLIFDECITGFRFSYGGAQEYYGVYSDIVVYSKAISGGMPMGVCAGKKEIMQLLADGVVYQESTYDANPMSIAAATEVLKVLKEEDYYNKTKKNGKRLIEGIDDILNEFSIPHIWQGFPQVFQFYYTDKEQIVNSNEALGCNNLELFSKIVSSLFDNKVSLVKGDIRKNLNSSWISQWFVSLGHGKEEIEFTIEAYRKSLMNALK